MRTEQSFAIVGGFNDELDQYLDTILMYQPQDYTWSELPGKLQSPRSEAIAIAVDISIFPQCSNVTTSTFRAPNGKTQRTRPISLTGDIRKRDFPCQIKSHIEVNFNLIQHQTLNVKRNANSSASQCHMFSGIF